MLESRPPQSPGTTFGIVLVAIFIVVDLGLLVLLVNEPVALPSFLWGSSLLISMPAIAFVSYWTSSLASTRYHVEQGYLIIEWGRIKQVVPLNKIRSLIMGDAIMAVNRFRGVSWPGCFVGHGFVDSADGVLANRETLFYATRPLSKQLLLVTDELAYALSPVDLANFADCLAALRVPNLAIEAEAPDSDLGYIEWPIWRDRRAQLVLATAVLLNSALLAYLAYIYGRLPVFASFAPAQVTVELSTLPANVFVLPALGLFAWLVNGLVGWFFYRNQSDRPVAFVIWAGACAVQVVTWLGLLRFLT